MSVVSRDEAVDSVFTAALTLIGIYGFRQAFGGTTYLVLGAFGLVLGLLLAHLTVKLRQPVLALVVVTVLVGFLLSGLVLNKSAVAGVLPSLDSVRDLAEVVVKGWKDLLTTVRPVGSAGNLLALPYVLGLLAGVAGYSLARRVRPYAAPLLPPALVVGLSILLGGRQPSAAFVQGSVFAALALAWVAVRRARERVSVTRSNQRFFRPVAGLAVLVVAVGAGWYVGPHVPGADAHERKVLTVTPPFDPGAFRSPLSGFRRYTPNAPVPLVDVPVLTVSGDTRGQSIRLGTLDDYDGLVWGASNRAAAGSAITGFARVGSTLPRSGRGAETSVRVTVAEGYRGSAFVPTLGVPQSLTFAGPRSGTLSESLRYNLDTATGIVPAGLQTGDVVVLDSRATPTVTRDDLGQLQPGSSPLLASERYEPVRAAAVAFSGAATTPMAKVQAIAAKLQKDGFYSDGRQGEGVRSDPGHGSGRLVTFVQSGKQIVGDDEQYAAAMALMAQAVGVPSRVVLLGGVESDGTVRGRDVSAAVELDVAGAGWSLLPTAEFRPQQDKTLPDQPEIVPPKPEPVVVPPPLRPLLSVSASTSEADSSPGRNADAQTRGGGGWLSVPGPVKVAAKFGGPPVLLIALLCGAVLFLKARRRRRRRSRGPATTRVASGWREVLDAVRDLGVVVPASGTRREQARALGGLPLDPLARHADQTVFGPGEPGESDVTSFWAQVDETRRTLVAGLPRWRRLRAALSLRSLVPALSRRTTAPGATA